MKDLGISKSLTTKICQDIYAKGSGLLWADSKEEFSKRAEALLDEWDALESLERRGPPQFASYFHKFKLADSGEKMGSLSYETWVLETSHPPEHTRELKSHDQRSGQFC